uniref:Uncharacterized protein n=1 Tax=Panagrolaimus sp. JU765 TaxID=591449 RepID=A0AC34RT26_9BILA
MTSYPNYYGHEGQDEAGLEVHQFYPLVEVGCYKHLKFFLCAMYTPICQENYDKQVLPCREVCLDARKRCSPLMQQYGFKWPDSLSCDQLPTMNDMMKTGEVCGAPPDTISDENIPQIKEKPMKKKTKNQMSKKILENENFPVIEIDVTESQCQCHCSKPFIVTSSIENHILNVTNCGYSCHSQALIREIDQEFMNTWITIWSGTCLALSLFTIFTFLIEMERFPYPERPIFYLAICQAMVACGFLLRIYFGHSNISCNGNIIKTGLSSNNGTCLLTFILIYFFGMSASTWWIILSLSWVLAAVPNWSTEWISRYSTYFHLFSWLLPGIKTCLIISFKAIDGDQLSGICYVGNTNVENLRYFVLYPLICYFIIGITFLIIGFHNLWSIRNNLKKTHPQVEKTSKLTQLMSKIGIFSFLYTVPALFVILTLFYEQYYRPLLELTQLCPCSTKIKQNHDILTILSLIKIASMLIVGWTTGVWVISSKTLTSWKQFLCCCFYTKNTHQVLKNHNYQLSHDGIPYMATSIDGNTITRNYIHHNSNGTSPLNKYNQQNDLLFTNHDCISPLMYGGGTLKHCQQLRNGILPEDV